LPHVLEDLDLSKAPLCFRSGAVGPEVLPASTSRDTRSVPSWSWSAPCPQIIRGAEPFVLGECNRSATNKRSCHSTLASTASRVGC